MVFQQRLLWRMLKRSVPIPEYAPLLRTALEQGVGLCDLHAVVNALDDRTGDDPEMIPLLLESQHQQIAELGASVENLEKIRPMGRALEKLHIESVAYLRGVALSAAHVYAAYVSMINGNEESAGKRYKKSEFMKDLAKENKVRLIKELVEIKHMSPDLYAALNLPTSVRNAFDLSG